MDDSVKKDLTFDSGQPHAPGANWCWQLWGKTKEEKERNFVKEKSRPVFVGKCGN